MGLFAAAPEPCYFCGSAVGPSSRRNNAPWTCSACGCWNGRDAHGVIDGDHPAMHDSAMNGGSFAKRGHPSSSRLPPKNATSPFCHTCQTNQTLVMNLLSTYLPDENSYAALVAELPAYRARLYARYPPVCARCEPEVDAALARADQRARAEAWGSALHRGASHEPQREGSAPRGHGQVGALDVLVWRLRGAAWGIDVVAVMAVGLSAWLCPDVLRIARTHATFFLSLRAVSLLWSVWDPTWLRRMRGRRSRVEGRGTWVALMLGLYVLRAAVALGIVWDVPRTWIRTVCAADIMTVLVALTRLRVAAPIELRLVRPVPVSPPPEPLISPKEHSRRNSGHEHQAQLAPAHAAPSRASPVFGEASLSAPDRGAEPMDWEPTSPSPSDWDAFGVGQQRMFAESGETGLEALLAGWRIGSETKAGSGGVAAASVDNARAHAMFAIPRDVPPGPGAPLLDGATLRAARGTLLAARVLATVAIAARAVSATTRSAAASTLLALEGATSLLTLGVVLASPTHAASPPVALLLVLDAFARFAALVAPASVATAQILVDSVSPELACIAWAAADLALLAATT